MWEKVRVGQYERITLKHVYYHMQYRWPVQVQCMKQDIQSWCSGTTQRDGVGREVRRGFRIMGHMYTHDWFMLMYGQNHHNIAKPYSCLLWRWIELKIKQLPKWKKEKKNSEIHEDLVHSLFVQVFQVLVKLVKTLMLQDVPHIMN